MLFRSNYGFLTLMAMFQCAAPDGVSEYVYSSFKQYANATLLGDVIVTLNAGIMRCAATCATSSQCDGFTYASDVISPVKTCVLLANTGANLAPGTSDNSFLSQRVASTTSQTTTTVTSNIATSPLTTAAEVTSLMPTSAAEMTSTPSPTTETLTSSSMTSQLPTSTAESVTSQLSFTSVLLTSQETSTPAVTSQPPSTQVVTSQPPSTQVVTSQPPSTQAVITTTVTTTTTTLPTTTTHAPSTTTTVQYPMSTYGNCVTSCQLLSGGSYQLCTSCIHYLPCLLFLGSPTACPSSPQQLWDDHAGACKTSSTTCNPGPGDACSPSPCLNGGTCAYVYGGSYLCKCTASYTGTNCQSAVG